MHKIMICIILTFLLNACEKDPLGADYVFLRHKGADLPVWVRGNLDADVFVIYLHGGPGGSSFIDIQNNFFEAIENEYAMVYYDQRASGNSIGHSNNELLTLDQFVEDLDVIVQYVQNFYSPSKIVLLGHSWGGTLGTAYLLNPEYQNAIAGWIEVDGGHNIGQSAYEYSRDYVIQVADSLIQAQIETSKWTDIKDYYEDITTWRDPDVIITHSKNVTDAGGYFYDEKNRDGLVGLNQILFSETDFLALLAQNKHVIENMDIWHYDFTNQLHEITIPKLLLWGKTDGILPLELAYEAKAQMDLEEDQFYVFQQSAHSPHYEQTTLFNQKLISFIKHYIE